MKTFRLYNEKKQIVEFGSKVTIHNWVTKNNTPIAIHTDPVNSRYYGEPTEYQTTFLECIEKAFPLFKDKAFRGCTFYNGFELVIDN